MVRPIVPHRHGQRIVAFGSERANSLGGIITSEIVSLRKIIAESVGVEPLHPAIGLAINLRALGSRQRVIEPIVADTKGISVRPDGPTGIGALDAVMHRIGQRQ